MRLTRLSKNARDASLLPALDLLIEIEKRPAKCPRQRATDRGLPRSGQTDEDDVRTLISRRAARQLA